MLTGLCDWLTDERNSALLLWTLHANRHTFTRRVSLSSGSSSVVPHDDDVVTRDDDKEPARGTSCCGPRGSRAAQVVPYSSMLSTGLRRFSLSEFSAACCCAPPLDVCWCCFSASAVAQDRYIRYLSFLDSSLVDALLCNKSPPYRDTCGR